MSGAFFLRQLDLSERASRKWTKGMSSRAVRLTVALASFAVCSAVTTAQAASALELQCAVSAVINAVHDAPMRKDGLNRYLIVSFGRGQRYLQCRFIERDTAALCEASSGEYGPRRGADRLALSDAQQKQLRDMEFVRTGRSKNYVRKFSMNSRTQIEGLAHFMTDTLFRVYGPSNGEKFTIASSFDPREAIARACPDAARELGPS